MKEDIQITNKPMKRQSITLITLQGSTVLEQNEILLHTAPMAKETEEVQVFARI